LDFFSNLFLSILFLKLGWLIFWLRNLFLFILFLYGVSVVCEIAKVIQVALVYGFGGLFIFFLIGFDFFIVYFLSHIVKKKIVLENSLVIKLYKITKIKGRGKLWIIIVTYNVLFFL
jgi:hypothetical protein